MEQKSRKTVGLILGSGGGRGMAHIGVIKTLQKYNIPIDYISGSSIGAVIGAYYALNLEVDSIEKIFKSIFKKPFWLLDFKTKNSFIGNKKIFQLMKYNLYGEKTFDDTKIPLRIASTNIDSGDSYIFNNGKIVDAVIPSMTIPGILPIVEKDNMHLVDGGLSNALPIKPLIQEFNPDVLIIVDLYTPKLKPLKNYSIKSIFDRVYKLYISKLSKINIIDCDREHIILNPDTDENFENLTFKNIDKNIKIGEDEVEEKIEEIKKLCL
jgi:NTE family protein